MGKIRTRLLGMEETEKKQKEEAKKRGVEKKMKKSSADIEEKPSFAKASEAKENKTPVQLVQDKSTKTAKVHVRSKKYSEARKTIDKTKLYSVDEAIKLLKKIKFTAFDQSVELHLNVDETGLRGEVELPNSTGKTVRIAVVDDKVLENIEKGKIDFDVLVTHPSFMPKLAKFAKVLGPKGLMPNPKAGTISPTPDVVVKKFQKGTIRWKTEAKAPLIHQMIGKLSHDDKALVENATKFVSSVGAKHIQNAFIKSTMSPSLKIEIIKE